MGGYVLERIFHRHVSQPGPCVKRLIGGNLGQGWVTIGCGLALIKIHSLFGSIGVIVLFLALQLLLLTFQLPLAMLVGGLKRNADGLTGQGPYGTGVITGLPGRKTVVLPFRLLLLAGPVALRPYSRHRCESPWHRLLGCSFYQSHPRMRCCRTMAPSSMMKIGTTSLLPSGLWLISRMTKCHGTVRYSSFSIPSPPFRSVLGLQQMTRGSLPRGMLHASRFFCPGLAYVIYPVPCTVMLVVLLYGFRFRAIRSVSFVFSGFVYLIVMCARASVPARPFGVTVVGTIQDKCKLRQLTSRAICLRHRPRRPCALHLHN